MILGQKKYLLWGRMLEYNVSLVIEWEVFRMKKREGKTGSIMFTGMLAKVIPMIAKGVDGLDRLNEEEGSSLVGL